MEKIILTLVKEIIELDKLELKDYYKYLKNYGKKTVHNAFNYLLVESNNEDYIFDKFFDAYFSIELDGMEIDHNSYLILTEKYGEDRVNNYFSQLLIVTNNNGTIRKKFEHIYFYIDVQNDNEYNDIVVKDDIVADYLKKLNHKVLSREEERKLFSTIKDNRNKLEIVYIDGEDFIHFHDFGRVLGSLTSMGQLRKLKVIKDYLSTEDRQLYDYSIDYLNEHFKNSNCGYDKYANRYDSEYLDEQLDIIVNFIKTRELAISYNLKLVVSIAKRFQGMGIDFIDLIQEGNIGLMKAITRFEPAKGSKFSTYATWWIRQSISRSISDTGRLVRIPVHMHDKLLKIKNAEKRLQAIYGHTPSDEEIANYLGCLVEEVKEIRSYNYDCMTSLNETLGGEDDVTLSSLIPSSEKGPAQEYEESELKRILSEVMETLTEREAEVLRCRFGFYNGIEYTLEEVGQRFGVTRERIRQIEAKAIRKLRHPNRSRHLKDFYE